MPLEATTEAERATEAEAPESSIGLRANWHLVAAAVGAVVLIVTSFVTVVLCSDRGLDLTDEGFYLLSYRWWNENYDNFTGAQYFAGPVFELLGFDIARFRIFRMCALIGSHTFFGLCFMSWLRTVRPTAPSTWLWNAAGAGAIVACSPAVYTWLPLSLGYNDLALICSLGLAGCGLRIARDQELGHRVAWWAPFGIGAVAVVLVLSKWSSSLVILLGLAVTVVTITATRRVGIRAWLGLGGWVLAGVGAVLLVLQFVLVPLGTLLPPMLEVNRLVAGGTNSPALLLETYLRGFKYLVDDIVRLHWPLLLVALASPFLRRVPRVGIAAVAVAVAASTATAVINDGMLGGPVNVLRSVTTLYAPVLAVLAVAAARGALGVLGMRSRDDRGDAPWSPRVRRWALLTMVAGMPFAQAAGTGNWVHQLAVIGIGFWMAITVHLLTGLEPKDRVARTLVGSMTVFLAVTTTSVAVTGLWSYPYRTTSHAVSTSAVPGLPALESLQLSEQDAADFIALNDRVGRYVTRPGRPMIAFDRLAGLVLALEGRPVGESWYSVTAPERARQGIVRTCERKPWWGEGNRPLVFFNRRPVQADLDALETCDIRIRDSENGLKNYRHSTMRFQGVRLHIYLPMRQQPE